MSKIKINKIKMKTHSGAKKRFKKLKSGTIKAAHAGRRKMLTKKTAKRKRGLRQKLIVSAANYYQISTLLPY
jgi:large subunit ribosomal protein L35